MRNVLFAAVALPLLSICGCTKTSHDVGIEGIREVGKVNVLYVGVAETMRMSSQSGNTSMLWLVRGGAFYQIDLKGMAFHKEGGTWVVELDPPEVYAVADMKRTKLHDARTSLGYTDKALNKMMEQVSDRANEVVAKAASGGEYMKMAKEQAEAVVVQMVCAPTTVKWRR